MPLFAKFGIGEVFFASENPCAQRRHAAKWFSIVTCFRSEYSSERVSIRPTDFLFSALDSFPRREAMKRTVIFFMLSFVLVALLASLAPAPIAHAATTWTNVASLNTAREYHPGTRLPNGKVFVEGGINSSGGNPLTNPLGLTTSSTYGEPVSGGRVTFTAPSSGASVITPTPTITVTKGAASAIEIANGTVGGPSHVTARAARRA
jgi:hypothetical protein